MSATCGHKPMPESGAYGHWYCQRLRFHFGRHRFNNYTWRRGARLWRHLYYAWRVVRHRMLREPPWRTPYARTNTKYDPTGPAA